MPGELVADVAATAIRNMPFGLAIRRTMTFLVRSKAKTAAVLVGSVVFLLTIAGFGYYMLTGRFAALFATGEITPVAGIAVMMQLQSSLLMFFAAVILFLLAALGLILQAEAIRRRNAKSLVHWLKHRGCEVREGLDLVKPDEGMAEIVKMIESVFPRTDEDAGGSSAHKEHVEELKSRFLEIITHQLQTPLTSVRWNLEALLKEELGPLSRKQRDLLSITDKNYEDILIMLSDWVEALDVERGFLRMNMEPLALRKYIDLVVDGFTSQAELKGIKVRVRTSKNLPHARADKSKLIFILKKLIHNAITYTTEEGAVEIQAKREGDYIRVVIKDSGVGIPYEEQQYIFKKFFRASNASLIEPNASGVGLFVTKTLIEAFGGTIGFESEEGRGTSFIFTIPAVEPQTKKKHARGK